MRGVAGMGSAGTGSAALGSTMASTNLEVSIGLAAHGSASASGRSGGHTGEPIPTLMRIRRWLWLPLPYMPHPYHTRREDKPLERGLIRFKTQLPTGAAQHSPPVGRCLLVL